ncbi:dihydroneopterin aldolase family protein [Halorubellus salinus]|uniref:dihydroneopterin aldolase family protein n=1 Tax=Halorubellus salinus TaxID=755309 RepID=UPI001D0860F8|nr:dihydroneopterin aldolase family protein [Halorubellus salinus]
MTADDERPADVSDDETSPSDAAPPTTGEAATFEAGIKFGSLYHQFAGTPVSPASADSLARAMEEAIENQPHCEDVQVAIRGDALTAAIDDAGADYVELTGSLVDVSMRIEYEDVTVYTSMAMQDGYPLMQVDSVERD